MFLSTWKKCFDLFCFLTRLSSFQLLYIVVCNHSCVNNDDGHDVLMMMIKPAFSFAKITVVLGLTCLGPGLHT